MSPATLLARVRIPLLALSAVLLIASSLGVIPPLVGPVAIVVAMAVYLRLGTVRREPIEVAVPVRGRWAALNSSGTRVPSHGTQAYGQAYAVDLVHEPLDRPRPAFGSGAWTRPPEDYPAFGQPVLAPADATVVRTHDRERDHGSRASWAGLAYMIAEGIGRGLLGPNRVLGNHVVLGLDPHGYALVAHLRGGSVRVAPGDRVRAGEQVAECGNTGNSSEPHVHFQVMDHRARSWPRDCPSASPATTSTASLAAGCRRTGRPSPPECVTTS